MRNQHLLTTTFVRFVGDACYIVIGSRITKSTACGAGEGGGGLSGSQKRFQRDAGHGAAHGGGPSREIPRAFPFLQDRCVLRRSGRRSERSDEGPNIFSGT